MFSGMRSLQHVVVASFDVGVDGEGEEEDCYIGRETRRLASIDSSVRFFFCVQTYIRLVVGPVWHDDDDDGNCRQWQFVCISAGMMSFGLYADK